MTASSPEHRLALDRYYEETWIDYRLAWLNEQNMAMHFGYWDADTRSHEESLLRGNRLLADAAGVGPGDDVVDLGCGVGGSAVWLAETRGARVCGVTICADQAARGSRYAAARGLADRVRIEHRDYLDTGFPDGSFDVAWAQESMCHAECKPAFLREAYRLLRPGGRLVVEDYARRDEPLRPGERALMDRWLDGWVIPGLAATGEFATWAAEAGFTDIAVRDTGAGARRSLRRLYLVSLASIPLLYVVSRLTGRTEAQTGNARAAVAQWRAFRRGLWHPFLVTARKPD